MGIELVLREARGMSDDALREVVHFMRYLKIESIRKYPADIPPSDGSKPVLRKAGLRQGQIWISDDFDAPLDDFREYM